VRHLGGLVDGLDVLRIGHRQQQSAVDAEQREETELARHAGGDQFDDLRVDFVVFEVDIGHVPEGGLGLEDVLFLGEVGLDQDFLERLSPRAVFQLGQCGLGLLQGQDLALDERPGQGPVDVPVLDRLDGGHVRRVRH
jgi:hypothetical protein